MKTTRCESKGNGWVHTPCFSSSSLDTATNRHLLAVDLANLKMALVSEVYPIIIKTSDRLYEGLGGAQYWERKGAIAFPLMACSITLCVDVAQTVEPPGCDDGSTPSININLCKEVNPFLSLFFVPKIRRLRILMRYPLA